MTRRERMERRRDRRLTWATSRDKKSAAGFAKASAIADLIPMGQPILVGHHSEAHARRDAARIRGGMDQGIESARMAQHHRSKAAGIADQLDRSIFSDDPDAIERLKERIAGLEATRARQKATNAAYRKGDAAFAAILGVTLERAGALRAEIEAGYSWCRAPFSITNLGANIRRLRDRLAQLERQ